MARDHVTIERTYPASVERVWELWTTAAGIEAWWAPDGFTVEVVRLDLVPGGELHYSMTATAPAQVEFMAQHEMPLRTQARKTFTQVEPGRRLAYSSLVDYVPDVESYEQETVVEFETVGDRVHVTMRMEPMHDEVWTDRLVAGRSNELDNLARLVETQGR